MSEPALSFARMTSLALPDVQAEAPAIPIVVDEAGVADLRYPITVRLADGTSHPTVASASLAASVPADTRGVHMSRFVEVLHAWHQQISVDDFAALLADMAEKLGAGVVVARLAFPLFLERAAPVSGQVAFVGYDCVLEGRADGNEFQYSLTAQVPITSLCPCSREISDYGAHNQRGTIEISVKCAAESASGAIDFSDLIRVAEESASAPIYALLKRTDERHVTMQAYENPAFVEDIARAIACAVKSDPRVVSGNVRVVNEESIHAHNAYAALSWSR